ncbi:hypothetical protein LTR60_002605 [Cryomyces antarcticus]|nr:hypothetical protein LTR60_002605 [Cryomyces antarcticus]
MSRYFARPFQEWQYGSQTLRAAKYKPKQKRKREVEGDDQEQDDLVPEDVQGFESVESNPRIGSLAYAGSTAEEDHVQEQYRVAGLSTGQALPPNPFPHGPATASKAAYTETEVRKELATLNPPLFSPPAKSQGATSLRQRHLSVMTTILHRCLLQGDYERAGRAWGMLLRAEFHGAAIDVRTHGRWGIGAEILLHRRSQKDIAAHRQTPHDADSDESVQEDVVGGPSLFSEEGFRAARDYYERLILQYPYRKQYPNSTNAMTFYPAMFGLWIYEIQEKSKRAREGLVASSSRSPSTEDSYMPGEEDYEERESRRQARSEVQQIEIRRSELREAREVAARLDELTLSPPYDTHVSLLQLRGMMGLYLADLYVPTTAQSAANETQHDFDSVAAEEAGRSQADREAELERAQECFQRVKEAGGQLQRLPDTSLR